MFKFKKGDKVIVHQKTKESEYWIPDDMVDKVATINDILIDTVVCVEFDNIHSGHEGSNPIGNNGDNCWCVDISQLEHIDTPQPVEEPPKEIKECYYDNHYNQDGLPQPIEIMQKTFTREELLGFLKGNALKYRLRLGRKDSVDKELTKIKRYEEWIKIVLDGGTINPRI